MRWSSTVSVIHVDLGCIPVFSNLVLNHEHNRRFFIWSDKGQMAQHWNKPFCDCLVSKFKSARNLKIMRMEIPQTNKRSNFNQARASVTKHNLLAKAIKRMNSFGPCERSNASLFATKMC